MTTTMARWHNRGGSSLAAQDAIKAKSALSRMKEKVVNTTESLISTAEVGAAAFGFGYLNGSHIDPVSGAPGYELWGVPLELIVGAGLTVLGQTKMAGKNAAHLQNLGTGALACYFASLGTSLGTKVRLDSPPTPVLPPAHV